MNRASECKPAKHCGLRRHPLMQPGNRSPQPDHFCAHQYRERNVRTPSAVLDWVVTSPRRRASAELECGRKTKVCVKTQRCMWCLLAAAVSRTSSSAPPVCATAAHLQQVIPSASMKRHCGTRWFAVHYQRPALQIQELRCALRKRKRPFQHGSS